jgi:hypothetical protein
MCARTGCDQIGTNGCSACSSKFYCSSECQKGDWKIHKLLRPCMKKGDQLLPFSEVKDQVDKFTRQAELKKGTESEI